ncbi:hypothetical protein GCM10027039_43240 [Terrabacter koreensis]
MSSTARTRSDSQSTCAPAAMGASSDPAGPTPAVCRPAGWAAYGSVVGDPAGAVASGSAPSDTGGT